MNRHIRLVRLAIFALGCAQAPERPTQVEDDGLVIALSTPRTQYLLGEPLMLELLLVNNTERDMTVPGTDSEAERDIGFYISLDDKSFKRVPRSYFANFDEPDRHGLKPSEVSKYNLDILGDIRNSEDLHWYFPKPSTYFIQAFFPVWSKGDKKEVRSNVVEVCVKEPTDPVDVEVWKEMKSWDFNRQQLPGDPYKHFLQTGQLLGTEPLERILHLYESYPTSSYRPAFRHALIKSRLTKMSDSERERLRVTVHLVKTGAAA